MFFSEDIHEPINLGNPTPITMIDLATEIIELTNSKSKLAFVALPSDDPRDREPDITNAKKLLNWSPKVSRSTGLGLTIESVRRQLEDSLIVNDL